MKTHDYFEQIGAWPRGISHIIRAYVIGLALSLALSLAAYFITVEHAFPSTALIAALLVLACCQFVVQVMCFLHLGKEAASHDRLVILSCAALIVLILVGGSLWIMTHLNERMMADPQQMEQYMDDQAGI